MRDHGCQPSLGLVLPVVGAGIVDRFIPFALVIGSPSEFLLPPLEGLVLTGAGRAVDAPQELRVVIRWRLALLPCGQPRSRTPDSAGGTWNPLSGRSRSGG